jgi:HK97 family phage prohead protease
MYRKNLVVTRKATRSKQKISFVASTDRADRYGDVINQSGWNLDAYRRNPILLLNHNANALPIGRGEVEVKDGQLLIDVFFDKDDELAQRVERKARNGFLNAVSVGFNPIEQVSRAELPKDHPAYVERGGGNYFNKSELLEVSIVTIPANSEATTMSAKNIDRLSIRDLVVEELKHILEVEQMEDGKYRIVFAGGEHEMEEDMKEESYHDEEESSEDDKDKKAMKEDEEDEEKGHYDDDEEDKAMKDDEEDEDEKKGFLSNKERELLYLILNKGR